MTQILERFNQVYRDFLEDLHKTFGLKSESDNGSDSCLDNFVKYLLPHMDNISVCNEDYFKMSKDPIIYLNESISLLEILNHKEYQKRKTKISFWKYLHTLYILSTKLVDEITTIIDNNKEMSKESIKMVRLVLSSQEAIMENLKNNKAETVFTHDTFPAAKSKIDKKHAEELSEINKELDEDEKPSFGGLMGDSLIGKLAEDLSKKVNPEDVKNMGNPFDLFSSIFGGGGASKAGGLPGGLDNIFTTIVKDIGSKFQSGEIDGQKLLAEANQLMGGIFPPGQMPPGMQQGQMPQFPQMDAEAQANFFRQMGAMGMMNQMSQMNPTQVPKNAKKKVIRRKKNK